MFNLIRKDLLVQKGTFKYIVIYIIFFSFIFDNLNTNSIYLMCILLSVYSLLLTAFTYDEKYRADFILNSLPLKRMDIVLSKYLSIIVYIFLSAVISGVLGGILALLNFPINMGYLNSKVIIHSTLIILFMNSITLPFLFKFGQKKGRLIVSVVFFSFFGAFFQFYNDMSKIPNKENTLLNYDASFLSILFIICLILFAISAFISTKIYTNKDLR